MYARVAFHFTLIQTTFKKLKIEKGGREKKKQWKEYRLFRRETPGHVMSYA